MAGPLPLRHTLQQEPSSTNIGDIKRNLSPLGSISKQKKGHQRITKARKYERYFDYIDPMITLYQGLYKYKDESDRKILEILNQKLIGKFGETAKFKDERSVLKYVHLIEDGETLSSIHISTADIYEPNKSYDDDDEIPEFDEPGTIFPDEMRKKNKNRPQIGAGTSGNAKAPNLDYMCKVCMDQAVSVTFIPCGHLVVCGACAPALGDCPVPNLQLDEWLKTYAAEARYLRRIR